jgi:VWFA-related protein
VSILLALSVLGRQEPPRFPSGVESVYVDVFVTRGGSPVRGLSAENFEVWDNSVRQEVRLVSLELVPLAVLLVFDMSASVAGEALGHLRGAGHAVLDGLRRGDRAALVTFNHRIVVRVVPTEDLARVRKALDRVSAFGATALYDATYVSLVLPVAGARPVVVLFSDGDDNTSWLEARDVFPVAARSDVLLQAVGVPHTLPVGVPGTLPSVRHASSPRLEALRRIAKSTGGRFWNAETSAHLQDTFLRILEELRTRYVLAFEPTGVERLGKHSLEVRLKGARGEVRSRRSYYVPPPR